VDGIRDGDFEGREYVGFWLGLDVDGDFDGIDVRGDFEGC